MARRYAVERAGQGPLGSRNGVYPSTRWHAEFERVKYMPCKRCVLRYRLLPERAGAAASARLYAKAYPDGAAAAPYRLQRAACLVEAEQSRRPRRQRFDGGAARQAIAYQVSDGKEREILGCQQVVLVGRVRKRELDAGFVEQARDVDPIARIGLEREARPQDHAHLPGR